MGFAVSERVTPAARPASALAASLSDRSNAGRPSSRTGRRKCDDDDSSLIGGDPACAKDKLLLDDGSGSGNVRIFAP
jgi:hypothetical protein